MPSIRRAASFAVLISLLAASSASAAVGNWYPALDLGAGSEHVAEADAAGTIYVASVAQHSLGNAQAEYRVTLYERAAGDIRWTSRNLGVSSSIQPRLAINEAGDVFVAFTRTIEGGGHDVLVARRDGVAGTWEAATVVSSGPGHGNDLALDVNASGDAVVAWPQGATIGATRIAVARFDGMWEPAAVVSRRLGHQGEDGCEDGRTVDADGDDEFGRVYLGNTFSDKVAAAIDDDGTATVAYVMHCSYQTPQLGFDLKMLDVVQDAGTGWSEPANLARSTGAAPVAGASGSRTSIAWTWYSDADAEGGIRLAASTGGAFGAPLTLGTAAGIHVPADVRLVTRGDDVGLAWHRFVPATSEYRVSAATVESGALTSTTLLGEPGEDMGYYTLDAAFDADGRLGVTYAFQPQEAFASPQPVVHVRSTGGQWRAVSPTNASFVDGIQLAFARPDRPVMVIQGGQYGLRAVAEANSQPPTLNPQADWENFHVELDEPVTLGSGAIDPDGDPLSVAWDLDRNGSFETPGLTTTFSSGTAGEFSIPVRAVDAAGDVTYGNADVRVLPPNRAPVADLLEPLSTPAIGQVFYLSDSSDDPDDYDSIDHSLTTWDLSAAPGCTRNETSGGITCTTGGSKTIAITVHDRRGGSDSDSVTVTIPSFAASVTIIASANPITLGDPVALTALPGNDGEAASFAWDLDEDGQYDDATGAQVEHEFTQLGEHVVGVQVSNVAGDDTNSDSVSILVQPVPAPNSAPVAGFTATPASVAPNQSVQFDGSSSTDANHDIAEWHWDFDGDGTVNRVTQTHLTFTSYAQPGLYNARLHVVDHHGAVSAVVTRAIAVVAPSCPSGTVGTPPNCTAPGPLACPAGTIGVPPVCNAIVVACPAGQVGVPPNCTTPVNPAPTKEELRDEAVDLLADLLGTKPASTKVVPLPVLGFGGLATAYQPQSNAAGVPVKPSTVLGAIGGCSVSCQVLVAYTADLGPKRPAGTARAKAPRVLVKLKGQTLKLGAGEMGALRATLTPAQVKQLGGAKGAKLVAKVTLQPAGGKPVVKTATWKLKPAPKSPRR